MNKVFVFFAMFLTLSPYAALADTRAAIFESQAQTALKSRVNLWRAFKRQARFFRKTPTCDTLILTGDRVLIGRIKFFTTDYVSIVPCDGSTTKGRRVSRDIILKIHRGQREGDPLAQKKGPNPALGNRVSFILGLISVLLWITILLFAEALGYLVLLALLVPPTLGLMAFVIGLQNTKQPEADKGSLGIIFGGISLSAALLMVLLILI